MPWKELSPVQQRKAFLDACIEKEASMTELCRRFGISRKTGYKWLDRYMSSCELEDRSRRPLTSPHLHLRPHASAARTGAGNGMDPLAYLRARGIRVPC